MNRLSEALKDISKNYNGRAALMTHVVLGYPTLQKSLDIVCAMSEAGASLIELQIPFSDPMADGPTIMHANEVALEDGITPVTCMKAMKTLSKKVSCPLLFMGYFNLLFSYADGKGVKRFCQDANKAGAQGLIIPDIPPEETSEGFFEFSRENNLLVIPTTSPITSKTRLKKIAKSTKGGFVYCVSSTGTTGVRRNISDELPSYLARVRREFKRPLAVGFGISTPAHVRTVGRHAEIAVVGSAMINVIRSARPPNYLKDVRRFTKSLAIA